MAAGATYEPIATQTLGSAAASITFSSIAASWTDLKLVLVCTTAVADTVQLNFNNDTGTTYSQTYLRGNGSAASSSRNTGSASITFNSSQLTSTTIPTLYTADIFGYSGSTYKSVLQTSSIDLNGSGYVHSLVGMWRSTAVITTIKLSNFNGSNFSTGTTATLYGIKAA